MTGAPTTPPLRETPAGLELLTAGTQFARYEVVRCIGVGGMGAVFEATHSLLRKRVAIKTLHTAQGRSEASQARFLREAETVARIRHPNVVDISDVGIERGIPFLVMEFLEGEDLSSLLAREGKLSPMRAVDLLLPSIAGLCAVHRLGIVHRDIKPENIFLATDTLGGIVPKLVDFGVSKDVEASSGAGVPVGHTVAGTPYYMAPEQARGSAVLDGRADQYALGVVLYQCLTAFRPFESNSLLELIHLIDAGEYQPLPLRRPDLPLGLIAVVQRAMARRADDRFASTEAFGQALAPFASEEVGARCAREFAVERRSALPSREQGQPLSAPTVPEVPNAYALASDAVARASSGVRARDTAVPDTAPLAAQNARSRRAFVLSALITSVLLLIAALTFYARHDGKTTPIVVGDPDRGTEPERVRVPRSPAVMPASTATESAPAQSATPTAPPAAEAPLATPQRARPNKPKRDPKSETLRPEVDIQLSR